MLKFQQIIKEDKIEFEKLPAFDKKVLNLIHQKVITPYEEHYGDAIDPIDSAEELLSDIDLVKDIYDQDINLEQNDLYIKKIYVDGGPTLKRFRPAAMGRAVRILKRTSNLTIVLSDKR